MPFLGNRGHRKHERAGARALSGALEVRKEGQRVEGCAVDETQMMMKAPCRRQRGCGNEIKQGQTQEANGGKHEFGRDGNSWTFLLWGILLANQRLRGSGGWAMGLCRSVS